MFLPDHVCCRKCLLPCLRAWRLLNSFLSTEDVSSESHSTCPCLEFRLFKIWLYIDRRQISGLPDTWTRSNTFRKQEGQLLNDKKGLNKKQWNEIQWYTSEIRSTKPLHRTRFTMYLEKIKSIFLLWYLYAMISFIIGDK